jgi:hypothetical protein
LLFKSDRISWLSTLSLFVALPIEAEAQPDENEERKLHMTHKLTPRKQHVGATGKPFSVRAHDIHRFGADDMVLESWHIEDWLSFLFQVGAMK